MHHQRVVLALVAVYSAAAVNVVAGWSQQFGGPASTSHVEISKDAERHIKTGWNYTQDGHTGAFYNLGIALSEEAILYLPFLHLPVPYYYLQLKAIAPNGTLLWLADHLAQDKRNSCAAFYLTNSVYDQKRNAVIVGWMCVNAVPFYPLFERIGQIKSINASDGSLLWKSKILPISDTSTLSIGSNVLYGDGGYDCERYGDYQGRIKSSGNKLKRPTFTGKSDNISIMFAINLDNGEVLWTKEINHTGCLTQTKIGKLKDGSDLVLVPVDLPPGPYDTGSLLALKCSPTGYCTQAWLKKLRLSYYARYAFSSDGVIFGSYGMAGSPNLIFGLNAETGDVLFSNRGYCVPGGYPSGPAVDEQGHAYYSCGNQVFAVDSEGNLIWKSQLLNESVYDFTFFDKLSVSIHQAKKLVVYASTSYQQLIALSLTDGSLKGGYNISHSSSPIVWKQPPITFGNSVYYLMACNTLSIYILSSISLDEFALPN